MTFSSTVSAFQGTLANFTFPSGERDFPETFAINRFLKKFEVPDLSSAEVRKQKCWDDWLAYDESLTRVTTASFLSFPLLYKARAQLHKLKHCVAYGSWDLPQGSEYYPTLGQNSVESRLSRSRWSCTYNNFEQFARFVYTCKAMKRAFRKRYTQWFSKKFPNQSESLADKQLYRRFCLAYPTTSPKWECFCWKLEQITDFVQGSRFSAVPKNNEVDRPINVEPLGNLVVQRQIGNFLRSELKRLFNVDLDTLADKHREMIKSKKVSTVDLKNASDSVTLVLCQFLLPASIFSALQVARSPFVLGLNKAFHPTQKISSMGNGFTFELMTLILTSVARQLDPNASVFGDDIIIGNEYAQELIVLLEGIGFVVNKEKTFVNSPFRESCGSNFHDDFGYVESYDFRYPTSIHDCVVLYNKTLRLSRKYPTFETLRSRLRRHIPKALQGETEFDFFSQRIDFSFADDYPRQLGSFFRCDKSGFKTNDLKLRKSLEDFCRKYCYNLSDIKYQTGFTFVSELRSPTYRDMWPKHWAKYEMYLHGGMVTKDVLVGSGSWVTCLYLSIAGTPLRWSKSALL